MAKIKKEVDFDKKLHHERQEKLGSQKKYKQLLNQNRVLERQLEFLLAIRGAKPQTFTITPKKPSRTSEATYVVVASDWHLEERVRAEEVNGLNEFNLIIMKERVDHFFKNSIRLYQMFEQDVNIPTIVFALIGDMITGNIHEEMLETCQLEPIEAAIEAQNLITSGIESYLAHTKADLVIPCAPGNHSRITKGQRHATELGNSIELYLYTALKDHFRAEKRVRFIIERGYHTYLDVYGRVIRFHHGHGLKYQGGVGGLYIPTNKAIAQWNKGKHADLDIFGHWHTFRDGGNFICNGSLIGYNAYALSIKAEFERPKQASFLIDKKRGKTIVAPVLLDDGGVVWSSSSHG